MTIKRTLQLTTILALFLIVSNLRAEDWPTYRHDAARSGSATTKTPAKLDRAWEIKLSGKLTQPIAAGGSLFIDDHDISELINDSLSDSGSVPRLKNNFPSVYAFIDNLTL